MRSSVVAVALACGCGRLSFGAGGDVDVDDDDDDDDALVEVTAPVTISEPGTSGVCASIVWSGAGWGVTWVVGEDTYFARLDAEGQKQGGTVRVTTLTTGTTLRECPVLAWSGSGYAIAIHRVLELDAEVAVHTLDAGGAPVRTSVPASTSNGPTMAPSIAWHGGGFHLAWMDAYQPPPVRFLPLDPTGAAIGTPVALSTLDTAFPTVTGTAPGSAAVWSEYDLKQIRFAALDAGVARPGMPIATAASVSGRVAAAWTGSRLGLAWLTDPFHLWFALADLATGTATAPLETTGTDGQGEPELAAYPGGFGMVLLYPLRRPALEFVLRDADGLAVGDPVPLAEAGSRPVLAHGGDRFAVVYDDAGKIQLVFVKPP